MNPGEKEEFVIDSVIINALNEDLDPLFQKVGLKSAFDPEGLVDVTSDSIFSEEAARGYIVSRSEGVLSGVDVVERVFELIDDDLTVNVFIKNGQRYVYDQIILTVTGRVRSILRGERTALNFLCHLSGIATEVSKLVKILEGTEIRVLDTRKTIPGLRMLEKKAVLDGGGFNHRMGLYDMVLIKDNHIDGAGSIWEAVKRVRSRYDNKYKIEVETRNLDEVREALDCRVDRIMLDNMDDASLKKAVELVNGRCEIEVSGNLTPERLKSLRNLKIDYVSFGYITSSSPHADFSLYIET